MLCLGSTPCRCTFSRCYSSTCHNRHYGVPMDDTAHLVSPVVSRIAASRHLSLLQRRRLHTKWARQNTQSLCAVCSDTGRSAEDVSPRSGSLLIVGATVFKTLLPIQQVGDRPRVHGEKHTRCAHGVPDICLARRWHFPGISPASRFCYTPATGVRPSAGGTAEHGAVDDGLRAHVRPS